jgi:Leu/Phe-tRNA-protein transferase
LRRGLYDVYVDYYEIVFAGSFELYINGEKVGGADARGAEEGG